MVWQGETNVMTMKCLIWLAVTIGTVLSVRAEEASEVPADLKSARFRYEIELVELNANYIRHLEGLKARYKAAGRSEDASAVDAEIRRVAKNSPIHASLPETDVELTNFLNGSRWQFQGDKVVTFQDTGEVHKSWGRLRPEWKVEGMQVLFESKVFEFSEDFKEMILVQGTADAGRSAKRIAD